MLSVIEGLQEDLKLLSERSLFGVLAPLADALGIASSKVRLFFIYVTFLTFGSPIFIYLALAFLINIGRYIRIKKRKPLWDF